MAQVGLQCPRIVALVGQGEAAGVPEHVGVSLEAELGLDASTLHHPSKGCRGEGRTPLVLCLFPDTELAIDQIVVTALKSAYAAPS